MDIVSRIEKIAPIRRWLGCGLVLVLLLPLLAACMGNDDDDAVDAPSDAGATATEVVAESTEPIETTAEATEGAGPTSPGGDPTASESGEVQTPPSATTSVPGDLPIDQQLSWLLQALNGDSPPAAQDVASRMHESFIELVQPGDFAAQIGQLIQSGPWEFVGYLGEPVGLDGAALVSSSGGQFQVLIGLEVPEPHRFQRLLIVPDLPPAQPFATFDEIDPWLADQAPQASFQVAEVVDGACQDIHAVNADEPLAIASTFKLWVLQELAERVAAGELNWDDELVLTNQLKSLPSGTLQVEPDESMFTLRTYAAKMMILSDNTATDHLVDFLGRPSIEERMAASENSAMDRNMPLLLTREMFYLKLVANADERDAYIAADDAGQREILSDLTTDFTLADPNALNIPTAIDSIEWFASTSNLCDIQADLYAVAQSDETLREILAASAGVMLDTEAWPFVFFKGGNEAGVASGAWLLERADGRVFSLTVALNNPEAGVDPNQLPSLAAGVAGLLASHE